MQKSIFLIICGLSIAFSSLTFDSSEHCSCDSLTVSECTKYSLETCEVSGSQCIKKTVDCSKLDSGTCNETGCIWDSQNKSCIQISSITCSSYTTQSYCLCYWNKSNQCESFSQCENYDQNNCPTSSGCRLKNNACTTLVCSDQKLKDDCYGKLSNDSRCAWNDQSLCVELSTTPSCSDLDNFQSKCTDKKGCQYISGSCNDWGCSGRTQTQCDGYIDDNNETYCAWNDKAECVELPYRTTCTDFDDFQKKCTDNTSCKYSEGSCDYKACSDFSKDSCSKAKISLYEFVLCSSTSGSCQELTDTTTLTQDNCLGYTSYNYHWTTDGKCQECATLISEIDAGNIIMGIITIILLIS